MEGVAPFAFKRNLKIDPLLIPCGVNPVPVPTIGGTKLMAARITTFKVSNPNPFWVWYRGWVGAVGDMPMIANMGHHLAPGAVDINTSQVPDFIAAVACDELGAPIFDANGNWLYPGKSPRIVMMFGSGM
jgi:hypothetical protein